MIASIFLQLSLQYQFSTIDIEPIIDLQRVRANDRNSRKIYYYRQYTDKKIIWHILDKNYLIGSYFHGY